MNFLAHIHLSFGDEDLIVGNFIAEGLSKNQWEKYPPRVVAGVRLHHLIDQYMDDHELVKKGKDRLYTQGYGKFSPVIMDLFYDHFLALHWSEFHDLELPIFAQEFYALMERRWDELSARTQYMLPYMMQGDWLSRYSEASGLEQSLKGMSRRSKFPNRMNEAMDALGKNFSDFEAEFLAFYPQIQVRCREYIQELKK